MRLLNVKSLSNIIILKLAIIANIEAKADEMEWDKVRERNLELGKTYDISSGTGFFVAPGFILTNEHVVKSCLTISMRGAVKPSAGHLVAVDKTHDLALIKTDAQSSRIAYFRQNVGIKPNDKVFAIGYPLEHSNTGEYVLSDATVITHDNNTEETDNIEFTASIEKGNSGGPLIDGGGNVIGVVQAKKNYYYLSAGSNEVAPNEKPFKINGLAIGLQQVKNFLSAHNINYMTNSSYDGFTDYQPDRQAKDYIVNVHCVRDPKDVIVDK
jgi:S1-C subfamily serine protease